ncbi:MAG TPA: hypothetical protein VGP47_05875 [Parachlamydiaceae bacterium]|nr:hypothetical protein [Parachlamydiaceae bacterium]
MNPTGPRRASFTEPPITNTTTPTSTKTPVTSPSRRGSISTEAQTITIERDEPIAVDRATNRAVQNILIEEVQPRPKPLPERPINSHSVKATPIPSPAEIFRQQIKAEHTSKKTGLEDADKEFKETKRNIKIQKIALMVLAAVVVVGALAIAGAACAFCPPAGAALAVGLALGIGYTATLVIGMFAAVAFDVPEDKRAPLEKNVKNLNAALELFDKYPKNTVKPDGTSFEEFLDTLPAITKDGVKVYELKHLDSYINLFPKHLNLLKYDNFNRHSENYRKIDKEIETVKNKLKDLDVGEPINSTSIQNKIDALKSDVDVEMQPFNSEQIQKLRDLSGRLTQLTKDRAEGWDLYSKNTRDKLVSDMKSDRELIEKAIAEQQKTSGTEQSNQKIETLKKELMASRSAYNNLVGNSLPTNLPQLILQNELRLEQAKNDITALEVKLNQLVTSNPHLNPAPSRTVEQVGMLPVNFENLQILNTSLEELKLKLTEKGIANPLDKEEIKNKINSDPSNSTPTKELAGLSRSLDILLEDIEAQKKEIKTLEFVSLNHQKTEIINTQIQITSEISKFKNIIAHQNILDQIESEIQSAQKALNPVENAVAGNNAVENAAQTDNSAFLNNWKSMTIPVQASIRINNFTNAPRSIYVFGTLSDSQQLGKLNTDQTEFLGAQPSNNFLSNAYPTEIAVEGNSYRSVTHYMLSKRIDNELAIDPQNVGKADQLNQIKRDIAATENAAEAYKKLDDLLGEIYSVQDTDRGLFEGMDKDLKTALWSKFITADGKPTAEGQRLLETGSMPLYAGYEIGDESYGMEFDHNRTEFSGQNKLGICLMEVRNLLGAQQAIQKMSDQLDGLKNSLDNSYDNYERETNSTHIYNATNLRIRSLKNEIESIKDHMKNGNNDLANNLFKKLQIDGKVLVEEASSRSIVHKKYMDFRENYATLSPEERIIRDEGMSNDYKTELDKYVKLIEQEQKKLNEEPAYNLLQSAQRPGFRKIDQLQNLKYILNKAHRRLDAESKGKAPPFVSNP